MLLAVVTLFEQLWLFLGIFSWPTFFKSINKQLIPFLKTGSPLSRFCKPVCYLFFYFYVKSGRSLAGKFQGRLKIVYCLIAQRFACLDLVGEGEFLRCILSEFSLLQIFVPEELLLLVIRKKQSLWNAQSQMCGRATFFLDNIPFCVGVLDKVRLAKESQEDG